MPIIDRRQYWIALTVRKAQRRIAFQRLQADLMTPCWRASTWGDEVDRISRRIFAVIMRGWL
jgi:hypothetical protein